MDAQSGELLVGANIWIAGTQKGTTSNLDGTFALSQIQSEIVDLRVTYLGYDSLIFKYEFKSRGKNEVTLKLKPSSINLNQVQVIATTKGETKAFMAQKNAENIKNVVSSEQIEKFPDVNAAEAMQRIPGITVVRDQGEGKYIQLRGTPPELTNFNINGEQIPSPEGGVRYVGMDIIAADQIENIEISKVLTPDMDGDAIGGSVNIVTKKAQSEKAEIDLTASLGYNALQGTNNSNFQFGYGQRQNKLGFQINATHYINNQGSEGLEFDYAKGPFWGDTTSGKDNYYLQYQEFQLKNYITTRTRTGLSATVDYQFNPSHQIYFRAMFNKFVDDEVRYRKIYGLEDAVTMDNYLYGSVEHDVKARKQNQTLNTFNMGGTHLFDAFEADYEANYSLAKEEVPDRLEAAFENPGQALKIKISRKDSDYPYVVFPSAIDDSIATDYANYEFDRLLLKSSLVTDQNIGGKLNFKIPYLLNEKNTGYFKFGGKVRFKTKERDVTAQSFKKYRQDWNQYPSADFGADLTLPGVSNGYYEGNLLNAGYVMEYMPAATEMRDFYNFYPHLFIYGDKGSTESKKESNTSDYSASEDIYAAYGMFHHDFDKLMVIAGLRYEQTNIAYKGKELITTRTGYYSSLTDITDNRSHRFLLPQVQIKYSFDNRLNMRGAVTKTFSRPNFDDILPYKEQERDEVRYGNPDLKYPEAINFDAMVERYINGNGILSAGVYYKQITNFVAYYTILAHEDTLTNPLYEINSAINGNEAIVYGAEFQFQSKFLRFSGFLKDFGIYSNYSFTYSEAFIGKRLSANYSDLVVKINDDGIDVLMNSEEEEKITLPGQAKHALNLALFYDSKKFYARLSANFHDKFLKELGADKDLDVYEAAAWHFDFTASYSFTPHLKLFIDAINLSNEPQTFYIGSTDYIKKQEYYSWWMRAGIKFNF